jgi:glycerol uptake facilitator-like aquaporin
MTIFEYLKEPHPWLDTSNYTVTQIVLFFIGSLLWLVCYADTLWDIKHKKTLNIPLAAILLISDGKLLHVGSLYQNGKAFGRQHTGHGCVLMFSFLQALSVTAINKL